jgi:hypothetical protein
VRRSLAELNAALAGVVLDTSFARFNASLMAVFSEEIAPSRPLGRWGLVAIVERQGSCEKAVWCEGCERALTEMSGHVVIARLVQFGGIV